MNAGRYSWSSADEIAACGSEATDGSRASNGGQDLIIEVFDEFGAGRAGVCGVCIADYVTAQVAVTA